MRYFWVLLLGLGVAGVGGEKGKTVALYWAAHYGQLAVVRYLVEQGADVNATDFKGETALHSAAEAGDLAVVEYLVGQGASLTATTNDGYTPKGLASHGHTDVVAYLESVGG